ncbi:MAG: hypothetical protein GY731_03475, partial [Gammaproteobacteria bacterium]|nr:hypothetical protein [Gammaproteobacteria bacterium]
MMDINRHTLATLSSLVWLGLCAMSVIAAPLASAAGPSLEKRVSKLERILNTGTLVELLNRVDALQGEVQELRGEIEQQRHTLDQLKQHQRELYLDVDRRMRRFESGGEPVAGPVET